MKVIWEESDISRGLNVWRDEKCVIVTEDGAIDNICALVVCSTSRIMSIGSRSEIADYLTDLEYSPTEIK